MSRTSSTYGKVITQYHSSERISRRKRICGGKPYTMTLRLQENKMSKSSVNDNNSDEPVLALENDRSLLHDIDTHLEAKISKSGDDEDVVDEVNARESIYHTDVDEFADVEEFEDVIGGQPTSPNHSSVIEPTSITKKVLGVWPVVA
jgi:hypothetical protein